MTTPANKNTWYLLDMAVFFIINVAALWYIVSQSNIDIDFFNLFTPFRLILFGLGVYRLADVVAKENVTAGMREYFNGESVGGLKWLVGNLITCTSCVGVWAAMILFYVYVLFPAVGSAIMVIMALSALERFGSKLYNLMERKAS